MKSILIGLITFASVMLYLPDEDSTTTYAATPGTGITPLLTCPNVTADATGAVAATDINQTITKFGTTYPNANFSFLFDRQGNGSIASTDIKQTITQFGATCPTVDNQVALATRWGAGLSVPSSCSMNNPTPPLTLPPGNDAALEAIGYYRGSTDVPGQGVHYFKSDLWDEVFDPCRPEGLVYSNDRLVAQLYVINGDEPTITWDTWNPPLCPAPGCGTAISGVDVDDFCSPSPCSWAAAEGWHAHANLCTGFVGTVNAFAIPGQSPADCDSGTGTQPVCTEPVTVQPCYVWDQDVGWMGHLWNHFINQNKEPVEKNGRFSDCAPPASAYNTCAM
jgi:hypothetical protein